MIKYEKFTLKNGLRCIVHHDTSTPMVAMNVIYDVGARDENPAQTGFAHLFEHLMFGGSINIPDYDEPLQMAGGENNAYTTNDITNYYIQLPAKNIETAFWLESDRMLSLAFSEKSLEVQRKVVCEEFKEHYINKPYGDTWKYLRELCYTQHPYQWMTIGKELAHIENAQLQDVKNFFFKHYRPVNAVLCVAGNITTAEVKAYAEKWFEPIESGEPYVRNIAKEPMQTAPRMQIIEKDVPVSVIFKAYHIANRLDKKYYAADVITEIFSGGQSSRLHQKLVKEQAIFSQIDCYHTGSVENGLLVIEGKILPFVKPEDADKAIQVEIGLLKNNKISELELEKVKNKIESMIAFEDLSLLSRANNLAFYELLGDAEMMNQELGNYQAVSVDDVIACANEVFSDENTNTLYYLAKNNTQA
ncbi:MAG: insulinase family protein [Bacteroidetes bacterium]|nr:insulinase family protein [Bacteroidota bacterium]MBK7040460.1 insulinase family protein [Bacteroidota bacterium]MBK8328274.1 insulinase family protein [Bacteroidota bacterium]MBK9482879.1 insulinase family protein [Bacteroidota bacterium]